MRHHTRQGGFTLIEVMISMTLLAVVLGSATIALNRGTGTYEQVAANNRVNTLASRAVDRLSREIRSAGLSTIPQNLETPVGMPIVWSPTLDFREGLSWDGTDVVWGPTSRLTLEMSAGELNNGIDDNSNGLIDERNLVLLKSFGLPGQQRIVISSGVNALLEGELLNGVDDNGNGMEDEQGFCVSMDGREITMNLSLQALGPKGTRIVRTQQDVIVLRNQ